MSFFVNPRYTPGSPAMVSEEVAERVAREEYEAYSNALSGIAGEDFKRKAETLGLNGIAEERTPANNGWRVRDLLTDETFFVLNAQQILLRDLKREPGSYIRVVGERAQFVGAGGTSVKLWLKDVRELERVRRLRKTFDEGVSISDLEHLIEVDFLGGSRRQEIQRTGRLMHSQSGESHHDIIMTRDEFDRFKQRLNSLTEKGFKVNIHA